MLAAWEATALKAVWQQDRKPEAPLLLQQPQLTVTAIQGRLLLKDRCHGAV